MLALILLTGMTSYLLGQARDAALQGNNSALSVQEVGIHACIRNHAKAHVYLSARQWLDNYASTHAEMSPMDYKAFLPSGRKVFYYYQYRKDMLERHGCLLGHGPSELGSTPRPNNIEPIHPREAASVPLPAIATTKTRPPARRGEGASTPPALASNPCFCFFFFGGGARPSRRTQFFVLHRCVSS